MVPSLTIRPANSVVCAGAFSVGVPEKFVSNYQAAQAFLGRLEGLCRDRRALEALRDSDAYTAFQGRWKLSVYYGLRFQVRNSPDILDNQF